MSGVAVTGETPSDVARGLLAELGGEGVIEDLRRLSGGASRETWSFVHVLEGRRRRLVLRRDPVDGVERHGTMAIEVDAIRAAAGCGVPVPVVIAGGVDFGGTGTDFVITAMIEGESLGPRLVRSPALAHARERFAGSCGGALAQIHRIDPAAVHELPITDPLGELERDFAELGSTSAAIGLALRLLRERPPTRQTPVVVHGDFRNGNLIVDEDDLRAVLDWELVHLGDPIEDLGWLCTQAWSFGGTQPVGGIGTYDDLLDGYESVSGWRPQLDDVLWWQLLGSVRWAVACLRSSARFADGSRRTVDAAALARRSSENELDILRVLEAMQW